jgi:hypothetical protein
MTEAVSGDGIELRLERQSPPKAPLDELVLLLQTSAEIEHSLMAQYLYAAFSLLDRSPRVRSGASNDLQRNPARGRQASSTDYKDLN